MKKLTTWVTALLLLAGGSLYAQSAAGQAKPQQSTSKEAGAEAAAKNPQKSTPSTGTGSKSIKSQATPGSPPTHIEPKSTSGLNPQSSGAKQAKPAGDAKQQGGQGEKKKSGGN